MYSIRWIMVLLVWLVFSCQYGLAVEDAAHLERVIESLESGAEPVRIVCFGDSITGVYYHTGGRRAWCDMLGIALSKIYPKAQIQMINAGISGNTTPQGLARMERDVIAHKPRLVVVMYGMNDVVRTKPEAFRANLRTIVRRCREAGAAVVLCTPNSVYPNEPRPMRRLAEYAQIVRDVAQNLSVPLADCFAEYERVRREDITRWRLLMSETIHPSMNGHELFAEVIARSMSGQPVSLSDVKPPGDALRFTLKKLTENQPLDVVAMSPFDQLVPNALRELFPGAEIRVTSWPVEGHSLAEIEQWGRGVRKMSPDLVVVAVPADKKAENEEAFIRLYSWVLNWSVSFGTAKWDLLPVLPSVTETVAGEEREREELARQMILGMDVRPLRRLQGDTRSPADLVVDWIAQQKSGKSP